MVRRQAFVLDDAEARDCTPVVPTAAAATVFAPSAAPTTSATATTT